MTYAAIPSVGSGALEDFAPEAVYGQHGYDLHPDRLVSLGGKGHDHSRVFTDDEGRIVSVEDLDD